MREKFRGIASSGRRPKRSALRAPSPFGATARCENLEPFPFPPFAVNAAASERSKPPRDSTRRDPRSEAREADGRRSKPPAALLASTRESETQTQTQTQPNTVLQLPNTDAAQSVPWPLCLLSVFAAEHHVRGIFRPSGNAPRVSESAFPEQ